MADESKPPEARVAEWLESSGAALELRVARDFRQHTWEVDHARYYISDDESTLRESDVVAVMRATRIARNRHLSLHFVVECKGGGEPWVLFEADDVFLHNDSDIVETFETVGMRGWLPHLQRLHAAPLLHTTDKTAYQIADTGKNNHVAFSAVRQAMAGVEGLKRDVPEPTLKGENLMIFIPVVVTAAPLFKVALASHTGEPEWAAVERMLLISRQKADDRFRSTWVLRDSAVSKFASDAKRSAEALSSPAALPLP